MDKTRIIERIRKLQQMTEERGATEAEALAAAEKLGKLMAEYNISQGELGAAEIKAQGFEEGVVKDDSGRKTLDPVLNFSAVAVAEYTDTIVIRKGDIGILFYGQEQDVQIALYLMKLFYNTAHSDYRHWKCEGDGQFSRKVTDRARFMTGFANRVSRRLHPPFEIRAEAACQQEGIAVRRCSRR